MDPESEFWGSTLRAQLSGPNSPPGTSEGCQIGDSGDYPHSRSAQPIFLFAFSTLRRLSDPQSGQHCSPLYLSTSQHFSVASETCLTVETYLRCEARYEQRAGVLHFRLSGGCLTGTVQTACPLEPRVFTAQLGRFPFRMCGKRRYMIRGRNHK